jgi:cell wall-associated NlpC family hydrolase
MDLYQLSKDDGPPRTWTAGRANFDAVWSRAADLLRFHRGAGFTIREHGLDASPKRRFGELHDRVLNHLSSEDPDAVFEVKSLKDGYDLLIRRHAGVLSKGEQVIAHAAELHGTPYVFGVTDCSWLTRTCYAAEGIDSPWLTHNAHAQHLDARVLEIARAKILPGDLLFHHGDAHVSIYLDDEFGGRVWDTEPHDTSAPWGGMLGVGVRIRPMAPGYYCQWSEVNGIGRVVAINGAP